MRRRLPILMYHRIESDACPAPDPEEARYAVKLDEFARQLDHIGESGYRGVSVESVLDELTNGNTPEGCVSITFDDGNRSDYQHALPMLAERGFSATFFVTRDRIGREDGLEPDMIREMHEKGMAFGAHGVTHRFLSTLDDAEQRAECADSKARLDEITGSSTRTFAPPGGRHNHRTVDFLRELGYDAMCTSRFGSNTASTDRFALRRLPVVRDTTHERFDAMIDGAMTRMLGDYMRASALDVARHVFGEKLYSRMRSVLLGGAQ